MRRRLIRSRRRLHLIAIAAATALPLSAFAQDVNFIEITLLRYDLGSGTRYGIVFEAGKDTFSKCELVTPSNPDGIACPLGEVAFWNKTEAQLMSEIGSGTGTDWTLTWDKGMGSEVVADIDFGVVTAGDFPSEPTLTHPLDGATDVPLGTSIRWTWPSTPTVENVNVSIFGGDLPASLPGPVVPLCKLGVQPPYVTPPVQLGPVSCLTAGESYTVVLANDRESMRDVSEGLSTGSWILDNTNWLAVDQLAIARFDTATQVPAMGGSGRVVMLALLLLASIPFLRARS